MHAAPNQSKRNTEIRWAKSAPTFPSRAADSGAMVIGSSAVRVISFKDTILYKRGVWLSAAALVAAVAAPSVIDGSILNQPIIHIVPLCILIGFWAYFLQKARSFSIVDEVVDCGDHLNVRRARTEIVIPFSAVASTEVTTDFRIHRITIHLRERTKIGNRIDFWPQASLWSNIFGVQQLVACNIHL
jgi:hypothetical protein